MSRKTKKRNIFSETIKWIGGLLILVLLAFLLTRFAGEKMTVSGYSMSPTLNDREEVILDTITYRFTDPRRFDIVVFSPKYNEEAMYIKRLVGLPGERIQIQNGVIFVNGEALDMEELGLEPVMNGGRASDMITLGEDEYFVLGDNRGDSFDSREPSIGNIRKNKIIGKIWLRVWPLERIGIVK